jgi:uncharacterized membrane protein HdeD (DUF308 family)
MRQIVADATQARRDWGWYVALGVLLILVGIYAIWAEGAATLASVFALGIVLLIAGFGQLVAAFMARGAGHVILLLLVGVLDIIVGLMLLEHPVAGALVVTLLLAALLVFGGVFRFVGALWMQFPNYGWVAISGVLSTILGLLLWAQWPVSAVWFIGFVVGLNFIFSGISWTWLGWKLKTL